MLGCLISKLENDQCFYETEGYCRSKETLHNLKNLIYWYFYWERRYEDELEESQVEFEVSDLEVYFNWRWDKKIYVVGCESAYQLFPII
jgi:hypothetical protein